MRILIMILLMTVASFALAETKIELMPELSKQVNAYTKDNKLPWNKAIKEDVQVTVTAKLNNLVPLVRTIHGDYYHTLLRASFHDVKFLEGNLDLKELTFYLERRSPTLGSGITQKDRNREPWPFRKGIMLTFRGNVENDKFYIVAITETGNIQPKGGLNKK